MLASPSHSVTPLRVFAILLAAIGLVPVANLLSAGHAVPWWRAAMIEWSTIGLAIVLVSALLAYRAESWLARAVDGMKRIMLRPSARTFELGAAIVVVVLAAIFAQYCFSGLVFTGDEMAQRWHARMLLSGHLFLHPEAHREFFSTAEVLDQNGRWFSQFPIGGPLAIALGMALGMPWIVNPLLAGVTAASLHRFLSRAYDDATARAATVLFVLSPFVLIMSASQLNHVATLALVTMALAALPSWVSTQGARARRSSAVVIGVSIGAAIAVRPLDGALVALVVGAFQLQVAWREPSRRSSLAWEILAGAVPVALLLWVNARTTGSPLLFGYDALNGVAHRPGFHIDPLGVEHTPMRALVITSGYVMKLNRYLFEWPIPAVGLIVVALFARVQASRWDYLLAALFAALLGGYAVYWFDGFFAGPRFLYTAMPALVLFAASLPRVLGERFHRPALASGVAAGMALCASYAWLTPTGVSSVQMRALYYRSLREQLKIDVGAQMRAAQIKNALVFVNDGWHHRLAARLRALGEAPMAADQLLDHVDACALQTALDVDDAAPIATPAERLQQVLTRARAAGRPRLVPDLPADQHIAIVPGSAPTPTCLAEVAMDAEGTMPFDPVLADEGIGADGRLGGDVVFARDMGPRNELLRERFGQRRWYRYLPTLSPDAAHLRPIR